MTHRLTFTLTAITLLTVISACGSNSHTPPAPTGKPTIIAVNYPLAWLCEQLLSDAADAATVSLPMPADGDPAFWEPSDAELRLIQQADLVVRNGAGYATWLTGVNLARQRVLDAGASAAAHYFSRPESVAHQHGPEGEHSHGDLAFTTWFDQTILLAQLDAIASRLISLLPEREAQLRTRQAELGTTLSTWFKDLERAFEPLRGEPILVSHPVYAYLARSAGFTTIDLHWEPGVMPDPAAWAAFDERRGDADLMLWEGEPHPDAAAALQQRGITWLVFDPCGNRPEDGDFMSVQRANLAALQRTLTPGG